MLLRSSSTPVLGSLLPSFSESPNNIPNHYESSKLTPIHHSHSKLSIYQTGSLNHTRVSSHSSPISSSTDSDRYLQKSFRRAQSEGNLEGLDYASSCSNNEDHFCDSQLPKMFQRKPKCLMLQTIPSFSFYNSRGEAEEGEEEETDIEDAEEREEFGENENLLDREVRGEYGDAVMGNEHANLYLENVMENMMFTKELRLVKEEIKNVGPEQKNEIVTQKMYLEKGLGIGGGGVGRGGGGDFNPFGSGGDDEGDKQGVEEYYKRMVEENPGNPLFLRNYAQFLYESKRDLKGAEEYYSRAILADPKDGELLSQYAKLVWELQHDQDRAASYFERAVQASPEDSHVQAAYASFLWETEDGEDEDDVAEDLHVMTTNLRQGTIASATA